MPLSRSPRAPCCKIQRSVLSSHLDFSAALDIIDHFSFFTWLRISYSSQFPPVPWTIPSESSYDPFHFASHEILEILRTSSLPFDTHPGLVISSCLVLLITFRCQKKFNSSLDLSPKTQIHIYKWLFFISIWMACKYLKPHVSVPNTSCSPLHSLSSPLYTPPAAAATSCVHVSTASSQLY